MACPADDVLLAFVERRALDPLAVERHVDGCASCRKMVAHLAELRAREGDVRGATTTRQANISASSATSATSPPTMLSNVPLGGGATRIDRYVVERELGRGGMGVVFLALDPSLHRRIAVKVVRPDDSGPTARARLLREARAMASLSHPNVVGIYDVGELPDGQVFLAMELVEGTTLRGALAAPNRNLARTLQLFLQAGRGLEAAHAVGLVHRDFKPDNVLVGNDGRVRVADFGLVRDAGPPHAADAEQPPLTQTGMVVGTPRYMAPEQCLGTPIDARVDQYAYCVALFEALTGTSPFASGSFEEGMARKIRDERQPWPASAPVTPELRSAVERGLAASPAQRHASMAPLLAIVERAAAAPYVSSPTIDAPLEMPVTALAPARMPAPAPAPMPMPMPMPSRPAPARFAPIPVRPQPARTQAPVPRERLLRVALAVAGGAVAVFGLLGLGTYLLRARLFPSFSAQPTAEEAAPVIVPRFEALVANPTLDSKLPCPPGTRQRARDKEISCGGVDGHPDEGPRLTFHRNGKLESSCFYRQGSCDGPEWSFRDSGALLRYEEKKIGTRSGLSLLFSSSGRPATEEHYRDGKQHGVARIFRDDGSVIVWERWADGVKVEAKRFDR